MRSAAQRVTDRTALHLLKDYWRTRGTCIESIQMPFGSGDPPLSWHLTEAEKQAIEGAWRNIAARTTAAVRDFLTGDAAVGVESCPAVRQPS
jgi:hypothetical protein